MKSTEGTTPKLFSKRKIKKNQVLQGKWRLLLWAFHKSQHILKYTNIWQMKVLSQESIIHYWNLEEFGTF